MEADSSRCQLRTVKYEGIQARDAEVALFTFCEVPMTKKTDILEGNLLVGVTIVLH
jgi:hypothetical protein